MIEAIQTFGAILGISSFVVLAVLRWVGDI
jgi:hypothetical protein